MLSTGGGGVCPARMEGASQDPTAQLLITGHPAATAALAPLPAAARLPASASKQTCTNDNDKTNNSNNSEPNNDN